MLKVAIIGATGYVGAEMVRLLALRDDVKITTVVSNSFVGKPYSEVYPAYRGIFDMVCDELDIETICDKAELIITALPHGVSTDVVPNFLEKGKKVIDHSGDFRFRDVAVYEQWYGVKHTAPNLIGEAVYGLPEIYADKIKDAYLVSNPGCYPTCSILSIAPLLKHKLVSTKDIVINSVSGVSGAGRKSDLPFAFCEADENFKAYGLPRHRHTPEIEQELSLLCGQDVMVSFTPHLAPMKRGMVSTNHLNLLSEAYTVEYIHSIYKDHYKDKPFVRVLDIGKLPETKYVSGTNYIDIGLAVDKRLNKVIVVSAIDNLGKGAASQAIQTMNIMVGFDETKGLRSPSQFI